MSNMTLISRWAKYVLMAFAGLLFVACDDDEKPAFLPQLPTNGGDCVKSYVHLGSVPSTYDWTFHYAGPRLTQADGVVRDPSPVIDGTYRYTSHIGYGYQSVAVSNSKGEKTEITLNAAGYIQTMTVNRNIYNFYYDPQGYLVGWNKIVFEDSFGQAQQYKTSASISYVNGNYSKIVYVEADNKPVELHFTPSDKPNMNGLLPATASRELGCLGFEHLYYAGLLGRSAQNLVKSINYEFTDTLKNYRTDFEYSNKNGNTVLCNYHTPDGNVASVSYSY